ncbi:alginate export protein [Chitinophaga skermanii]|uniref:Alginate export protein n=1 Tax=Chitinophaga skermanii TaxID=331697 RepID=A0A327QSD9_9BACT|nr:alginate export family protein [Chitinophaga skermanii]RAJ06554.1 alginate export protein [Chitinophaga skermanii]
MKKILISTYLIAQVFVGSALHAQTQPKFASLYYNEDYSYLRKDSALDMYGKMKYTKLHPKGTSYVTFGADVRFQYFYVNNEAWGLEPKDSTGYVLSRFLVHADMHLGKHFRVFAQLQSSQAGDRMNPSGVEENILDGHQFFFDVQHAFNPQTAITLRVGRQELQYGSQRLIAVREAPNNRQSFDAARVLLSMKNQTLDAWYSHAVPSKHGIFDDRFNRDNKFWGVYYTHAKVPVLKHVEFYYLGLWKANNKYDQLSGEETRHSVGTRIWHTSNTWRYDWEALYQFGKVGTTNIRAWTVSSNTSYVFDQLKVKAELGLKSELISGNRSYTDNTVETFNPLYPRGAYFGLAPALGPANLIDVHPYVNVPLHKKLTATGEFAWFWRYSEQDGMYGPNGAFMLTGKNVAGKSIGQQLSGSLGYRPNPFTLFRLESAYFRAGEYLKNATPGKNIFFTCITAQLKL